MKKKQRKQRKLRKCEKGIKTKSVRSSYFNRGGTRPMLLLEDFVANLYLDSGAEK